MMKSALCKVFAVLVLLNVMLVKDSFSDVTYVIDSPTTGMMDYGSYDLNFRLFSGGGVLTRLNFGVFKIVNVGFGWELNRLIGSESVIVAPPSLFVKLRPFTGDMVLPSFAVGYDGQGLGYNKDLGEYAQKERGVFIALGREVFFPGFAVNIGANMNDFKTNTIYTFLNCNINYEDQFMALLEYDNINTASDARLNFGIRFAITGDLGITLAGKNIGSSTHSAERIIGINYNGNF